jgi:hypothetical protein
MLVTAIRRLESLRLASIGCTFSIVKSLFSNQKQYTNPSLGFIVRKNSLHRNRLVGFDRIYAAASAQPRPDAYDPAKILSYEIGLEMVEFLLAKRLSQEKGEFWWGGGEGEC